MSDIKQQLINKFQDKTAKIAILGQGYVGLPLSIVFLDAGFEVVGIDPDQSKVTKLNQGISYIDDVPTADVEKYVKTGKFSATTDFAAIKESDAVSVCVPTPLRKTGDPDLSFIVKATQDIKEYLHAGLAVVLESTTYPGTTRELMLPTLSEDTGFEVGKDFFLAFSPERVDPGREDWTTVNTPKVMGGITEACSEVCTVWYEQALDTVFTVTSTEVAEMTKLLENTFRMVNIGLVNELAVMCEHLGIDVWEVIDAADTKPFGFMKFTPGPGLGGHCIPIDPLYLSWKLKALNYNAKFIELASEINTNMPRYVINRVMNQLNTHGKSLNGSKVLVLGAAYKPDIDDLRESPALDIIGLLIEKKADVSYHDPYVPGFSHETWHLDSVPDLMRSVSESDLVVIVTDHSEYNFKEIVDNAKLIFDSRNATGDYGRKNNKVEFL